MSANPSAGPANAWDDDWETQADKLSGQTPQPERKVSSKVTKAQRRAQQAEFNRQLWAEAESPQTFHFLETQSNVPLKQDLKPTVTLLSRKPQPSQTQSQPQRQPSNTSTGPAIITSATAGMARLAVASNATNDGASAGGDAESSSDSDSERKPPSPTPQERHIMALRNLEERQKKYEEVRERLFGSPSANTSGNSSPRGGTPPSKGDSGRGKGRGRGGGGSGGGRDNNQKRDPSSASSKSRQLYDPGNGSGSNSKASKVPEQQSPRQPFRHPRGPDADGRGGFKGRGSREI